MKQNQLCVATAHPRAYLCTQSACSIVLPFVDKVSNLQDASYSGQKQQALGHSMAISTVEIAYIEIA